MKHLAPLFSTILLSIFTLTSCVTGPPKAATSKHANAVSAGFSVNGATQKLYGMVTFQVLDLEKGKYTAIITFENPDDPEVPFKSIQQINEGTKLIFMRTPDLNTLEHNKRYIATLTLHQDNEKGKVVSKLKQPVLATISPGMAEELNIATEIKTNSVFKKTKTSDSPKDSPKKKEEDSEKKTDTPN